MSFVVPSAMAKDIVHKNPAFCAEMHVELRIGGRRMSDRCAIDPKGVQEFGRSLPERSIKRKGRQELLSHAEQSGSISPSSRHSISLAQALHR